MNEKEEEKEEKGNEERERKAATVARENPHGRRA